MKKKTAKVTRFIDELHEFIVNNPQFRDDTVTKSEAQIQTEIRPLIIRYLEQYFRQEGTWGAPPCLRPRYQPSRT